MNKNLTTLSKRGSLLINNEGRVDTKLFMEASQDIFCPIKNPNGKFPLNVAENSLTASIIKEKLTSIVRQKEIPNWVLKYTHFLGHPEVRTQVASFMEKQLCKCYIDPDTIGFSAGTSAIIEVSSYVLADKDNVVVIPAPSYPMYTNDFGVKNEIERYDLQTHFDIEEIGSRAPVNTIMLDNALTELKKQNRCFKILLITSPDNPTGCLYSNQELKELANWCINNKIHMIVNEIYGLSLIDTKDSFIKDDYSQNTSFSSFANIMSEKNSDYLHLWYAFSKDFSMSGLRFGVLHSLNKNLLKGFENSNLTHMVSNITQWIVGEMLKDSKFIDDYIIKNKSLLVRSYKLVIESLKKIDVHYIPSSGSLFVWADFSKFLQENSDESQEKLWLDIYENTGVLLTPGAGFQHKKKGMFRIVFTAVPFKHLEVAMGKLTAYLLNK